MTSITNINSINVPKKEYRLVDALKSDELAQKIKTYFENNTDKAWVEATKSNRYFKCSSDGTIREITKEHYDRRTAPVERSSPLPTVIEEEESTASASSLSTSMATATPLVLVPAATVVTENTSAASSTTATVVVESAPTSVASTAPSTPSVVSGESSAFDRVYGRLFTRDMTGGVFGKVMTTFKVIAMWSLTALTLGTLYVGLWAGSKLYDRCHRVHG